MQAEYLETKKEEDEQINQCGTVSGYQKISSPRRHVFTQTFFFIFQLH